MQPKQHAKTLAHQAAIWGALLLLGALSCTPSITSTYPTAEALGIVPQAYEVPTVRSATRYNPCADSGNYIPDTTQLDHMPMRYVRVNFHWMNSSDSSQALYGPAAVEYTKGIVHAANYDLNKNRKMWLPHNNNTPVLPTLYRIVLSPRPGDPGDEGVYWHFDDELYYYVPKGKYANLTSRAVIKKYGVQLDTVINIFLMPHHPDSLASPTYAGYNTGIALSNAIKYAANYDGSKSFWDLRGSMNHEMGHLFGLSHTWSFNDGCDDTPTHPQSCFNRGQRPECDTITSNNVMDYNAMRHAWSPCQIGRIHQRMSNEKYSLRNTLVPTWCTLNPERHIVIRDTVDWLAAKDLEGHLTIEQGASLSIHCRVSVPKGARITVRPGGTLVLNGGRLHNACGDEWAGIELQEQKGLKGQVLVLGGAAIEDMSTAAPSGS